MTFSELEMILDKDVPWHKEDFVRLYEAKLLDNQPALRNLISGIDTPSREAVERTITSVQTLALDCTKPTAEYYRPIFNPVFGTGKMLAFASLQSSVAYLPIAALVTAFARALPKETLTLTAGAVAHASRINFEILGAMTGSAALAALDFSTFAHESGHVEVIQTSYSGRLAAALREVLNEREITDKTVKPLEALIETKVASLPQNRVSAEGMFTLFMTQLAVLISYEIHHRYVSSGPSWALAGHSRHLSYIFREVLENTKRLIPQRDDNTYYRVLRQVGVSARPKPRTSQLGLLVPAQTVRLVERSHKWISVEYFDQLHGVARKGWAPKKYFQQFSSVAAQPARELESQSPGSLTDDERRTVTENWDQTNERRIDLIYKKAEHSLTDEEQFELDRLQRLTDERIRLVAPLPLSALESVLEKLERRT
jgi:hypothetical protein